MNSPCVKADILTTLYFLKMFFDTPLDVARHESTAFDYACVHHELYCPLGLSVNFKDI